MGEKPTTNELKTETHRTKITGKKQSISHTRNTRSGRHQNQGKHNKLVLMSNNLYLCDMKKCKTCSIEKPLDQFMSEKKNRDGKMGTCKICVGERRRVSARDYKREIYYPKNRIKILENQKQYQKDNIKERLVYSNSYVKKRKKEDPLYRFRLALSRNIRDSFKRIDNRFCKTNTSENILGCTIENFRLHIQSLFTDRMSFDNYGDWELDHIIPISSAKTLEDIEKLCHYTNYQPLWAEDNLKKSNKILEGTNK